MKSLLQRLMVRIGLAKFISRAYVIPNCNLILVSPASFAKMLDANAMPIGWDVQPDRFIEDNAFCWRWNLAKAKPMDGGTL